MGHTGLRRKAPGTGGILATVVLLLLAGAPALAASGESGGGVTVVPDWTVIIQIANFLFLILALNLLLYRPIRRILRERRDKFKAMESAIDGAAKGAQEKSGGGRGAPFDRGDSCQGSGGTGGDAAEDRQRR